MYSLPQQQKKVEMPLNEVDESTKTVLKESNYSDDDVWEPSREKPSKEKPPTWMKPAKHTTTKKVQLEL